MPISPIDIFRPTPLDGVGQILASANNYLVQGLNNAVQIGRDHASLRGTQERDYLAERERVENMSQRRAEQFQAQQNTDRSFAEHVLESDRSFEQAKATDERDYRFKVRTDSRDAALRAGEVASVEAARAASTGLAEKKFELDKEEVDTKKTFLRTRAADILNEVAPRTLIQRILGTGNDPLPPVNQVQRGTELKSIGAALGDPDLASKGDALIAEGTKGVAAERERIRQLPRKSMAKAPKTVEEEIAALEIKVQAAEEELAAREKEGQDTELTLAAALRVRENKMKLDQLRAKAGIKGAAGGPVKPGVSAYEAYKNLVKKKP